MNDVDVLAARGPKASVDSGKPYAFLVEPERTAFGIVEDVATIFLTNKECPFRCIFCDLWKHTLDEPTPLGAIPAQIDYALERSPPAQHIKLYNSGNFFDAQAIPPPDWPAIAERVRGFRTVIVENHPRLVGERCLRFQDLLHYPWGGLPIAPLMGWEARPTELEIAMGLETVEPHALSALNKRMTLDEFARAAKFLTSNGIAVRAFLLLQPPYMPQSEAVAWAIRGIDFAFNCGVRCISIIPTRADNGLLKQMRETDAFTPPTIAMLEQVVETGIAKRRGRVFADLWDAERFSTCEKCCRARIKRLQAMNLTQSIPLPIQCECQA